MPFGLRTLVPVTVALAGFCCVAADDGDLLTRIRYHMRDYVSRLPDYTCRVTIERSARRSGRGAFELTGKKTPACTSTPVESRGGVWATPRTGATAPKAIESVASSAEQPAQ